MNDCECMRMNDLYEHFYDKSHRTPCQLSKRKELGYAQFTVSLALQWNLPWLAAHTKITKNFDKSRRQVSSLVSSLAST